MYISTFLNQTFATSTFPPKPEFETLVSYSPCWRGLLELTPSPTRREGSESRRGWTEAAHLSLRSKEDFLT